MRLYRRPVAWALLLSLLFVQIGAAAYACTREGAASLGSASVVTSASSDCEGMQMPASDQASSDSSLCVNHCTHATDATTDAPAPVLQWMPVLVMGLSIVDPMSGDVDRVSLRSNVSSLAHAFAPPIAILLGRFLS